MADPRLMSSEPLCRLMWLGILAAVDDQGRMLGQPEYVRSQALPYDAATTEHIADWLTVLDEADMLLQYNRNGLPLLQVAEWWDITSQQFARPSQYPAPNGWKDRIRYTPQRSRIVTCNWITRDGRPVVDTCDERGKLLPAARSSLATAALRAMTETTTVVTPVAPPPPRLGENNELPPARQSILPTQAEFGDPRKFANGRVPAGTGQTPVEVYYEIVSTGDYSMPTSTMERVQRVVTDLSKWRDVVRLWQLAGFKAGNVKGMLDWYQRGIPGKYQEQGQEAPNVRANRIAPSAAFADDGD